MPQFFESIRLINGQVRNLVYHQKRVQRTCQANGWKMLNLKSILSSTKLPQEGLFRIRISYTNSSFDIAVSPYEYRHIKSLKLLHVPESLAYDFKSEDRTLLTNLMAKRGTCDDILICRNSFITDTSYSNVLFLKNRQWFTPETYLLPGIMRHKLLEKGHIKLASITVDNFKEYERIKLINALNPPYLAPSLPVENIVLTD